MTRMMTKTVGISLSVVLALVLSILSLPIQHVAANPGTIHVSPAGSDIDGDGSESNPYATIQKGIDVASPDGIVLVHTGFYEESIEMKSGVDIQSTDGPVTIKYDNDSSYGGWKYTVLGAENSTIEGFIITGGAHSVGIIIPGSSPQIKDNIIENNGMGILCLKSSSIIEGNTIRNNWWEGITGDQSSPTIRGNTIVQNNVNGISSTNSSSGIIINNTIQGSETGVYSYDSSPEITNNIIKNNVSKGIWCRFDCDSIITNNVIHGNSNHGIYCEKASPTITNNTIQGNAFRGIYLLHSSPHITNNVVHGNGSYGIFCDDYSTPSINYNDVCDHSVSDYEGCPSGEQNISEDPMFVDLAGKDYHLQEGSLCINAGTNDAQGLPEFDFDGNPRIFNGTVDLGAFESPYMLNQPPIANAGDDQIVEVNTIGGANVILDGSDSTDPDGDPLTYHWSWDGGTAEGTNRNPTVLLPRGTTEVTLIVNDGTRESEPDTVEITVISSVDSLTIIVEEVSDQGFIDDTEIRDSLLDKIHAAMSKIDQGQTKPAINIIRAFIKQVSAQTNKHISEEVALILINDAEYVITTCTQ